MVLTVYFLFLIVVFPGPFDIDLPWWFWVVMVLNFLLGGGLSG